MAWSKILFLLLFSSIYAINFVASLSKSQAAAIARRQIQDLPEGGDIPDDFVFDIEIHVTFKSPRLKKAYIALQAWKRAIFSDPHNFTGNWNGPELCLYRGVFCAKALDEPNLDVVAGIDLNRGDIAGYLPVHLGLLSDIALFHVNTNRFCGIIPKSFRRLHMLHEFDVSNNRFVGPFPEPVLQMRSVKFIDLRYNNFEGKIPPMVFEKKLDALFLNDNRFVGNIPQNLGNSPVSVAVFGNNQLTGCIPRSIGNMVETLDEFILLNNQISGCLPMEMGMLRNTSVIDVSKNNLTGPLSPNNFAGLRKLEELNVAHNTFTGFVPAEICKLPLISSFAFSHNYFNREAPECKPSTSSSSDPTTVFDDIDNCIPGLPRQKSSKRCEPITSNPIDCQKVNCPSNSLPFPKVHKDQTLNPVTKIRPPSSAPESKGNMENPIEAPLASPTNEVGPSRRKHPKSSTQQEESPHDTSIGAPWPTPEVPKTRPSLKPEQENMTSPSIESPWQTPKSDVSPVEQKHLPLSTLQHEGPLNIPVEAPLPTKIKGPLKQTMQPPLTPKHEETMDSPILENRGTLNSPVEAPISIKINSPVYKKRRPPSTPEHEETWNIPIGAPSATPNPIERNHPATSTPQNRGMHNTPFEAPLPTPINGPVKQTEKPSPEREETMDSPIGAPWMASNPIEQKRLPPSTPQHGGTLNTPAEAPSPKPIEGPAKQTRQPPSIPEREETMDIPIGSPWMKPSPIERKHPTSSMPQNRGTLNNPTEAPMSIKNDSPVYRKRQPPSTPEHEETWDILIGAPSATPNPIERNHPATSTPQNRGTHNTPFEAPLPTPINGPVKQTEKPSPEREETMDSPIGAPWMASNPIEQKRLPPSTPQHGGTLNTPAEAPSPKPIEGPAKQTRQPPSIPEREETMDIPIGSPWMKPSPIERKHPTSSMPQNRGTLNNPTEAPMSIKNDSPVYRKRQPPSTPEHEETWDILIGAPSATPNPIERNHPATSTPQNRGTHNTPFEAPLPTPINGPVKQTEKPSPEREETMDSPIGAPWMASNPIEQKRLPPSTPQHGGTLNTPAEAPSPKPIEGPAKQTRQPPSIPEREETMDIPIGSPWMKPSPIERKHPTSSMPQNRGTLNNPTEAPMSIKNDSPVYRKRQPPSTPEHEETWDILIGAPSATPNPIERNHPATSTPQNRGTHNTPFEAPLPTPINGPVKQTEKPSPEREETMDSPIGAPWMVSNPIEQKRLPPSTPQHGGTLNTPAEAPSPKPIEGPAKQTRQPPSIPEREETMDIPIGSPWMKPSPIERKHPTTSMPQNRGTLNNPTKAPMSIKNDSPVYRKRQPPSTPEHEETWDILIGAPSATPNPIERNHPATSTPQNRGMHNTPFEAPLPTPLIDIHHENNDPMKQPLTSEHEEPMKSPIGAPWTTPTNEVGPIKQMHQPSSTKEPKGSLETSTNIPWNTPKIDRIKPSLEPQQEAFGSPSIGSPWPNINNDVSQVKRKRQPLLSPQNEGTPQTPTESKWPKQTHDKVPVIQTKLPSPTLEHQETPDSTIGHPSITPLKPIEEKWPQPPNNNGPMTQTRPPSSIPNHKENYESPIGSPWTTSTINVATLTNDANSDGRTPKHESSMETPIGAPWSTRKIGKMKPSLEPHQEDMTSPQIGSPWSLPKDNENHVGQKSPSLTSQKHGRTTKTPSEIHSPMTPNKNGPWTQSQPPSLTSDREENVESLSGSPWVMSTNEVNSNKKTPKHESSLETPTGAPWSTPQTGKTTPLLEPNQKNITSPQIRSHWPTPKNNENHVGQESPSTSINKHEEIPNTLVQVHSPKTSNEHSPLTQPTLQSMKPEHEENTAILIGSHMTTPTNDANLGGRIPKHEAPLKKPTGSPWSKSENDKTTPSLEPQQGDTSSQIGSSWLTPKNDDNKVGQKTPSSTTQQHKGEAKPSVEVHSPNTPNKNDAMIPSPLSTLDNEENMESPIRSPSTKPSNNVNSIEEIPKHEGSMEVPTNTPWLSPKIGKTSPSLEPHQEDMTSPSIESSWSMPKNNEGRVHQNNPPSTKQQHVGTSKTPIEIHSPKKSNKNDQVRQPQTQSSTFDNEENNDNPIGRLPNNERSSEMPIGTPLSTPESGKTSPSLEPQQEEMIPPKNESPRPTPTNNENQVGQQSSSTTQQHVGAPKTSFEVHSPKKPNKNGQLRQPQSSLVKPENDENVETPSGSPWTTPTNDDNSIKRSQNNGGPSETPIGAPWSTPKIGKTTLTLEPQQEDMISPKTRSTSPTSKNNENHVKRQSSTKPQQHVGLPKKPFKVHSPNTLDENGPLRQPQPSSQTLENEEKVERPFGSPLATPKKNANLVGKTPNNRGSSETPIGAPWPTSKNKENQVGQQSSTTMQQHIGTPKTSFVVNSPKTPNQNGPLRLPKPSSTTLEKEENEETPSKSPWVTPTKNDNLVERSPNTGGHLETPIGAPWSGPVIGKTMPSLEPLQEDMTSPHIGSLLPTSKNNENQVGQQSPTTTQQHVGAPKKSFKVHSPKIPNENGPLRQTQISSWTPANEENVKTLSGSLDATPINNANSVGRETNNRGSSKTPITTPWPKSKNNENPVGQQSPSTTQQQVEAPVASIEVHSPKTPIENGPMLQSQAPSLTPKNEKNVKIPSRSPSAIPINDDNSVERSPNNGGPLETLIVAPLSRPEIGKTTPSLEPLQEDMASPHINPPRSTSKNNENQVGQQSPTSMQHVGAPKTSFQVHSPKTPDENGPLRQPQPSSQTPEKGENVETPFGSPWVTPTNNVNSIGRAPNNRGSPKTPPIGVPWPTLKNKENEVGQQSPTTTQQHIGAPKTTFKVHSPKLPNENGLSRQPQKSSLTSENEEYMEASSGSPWATPPNNGGPLKTPNHANIMPSFEAQHEDMMTPQIGSPRPTSKNKENQGGQKSPTTTHQHIEAPKSSFEVHLPITPIENSPLRQSQPPPSTPQNEENLEKPSKSPWETPTNDDSSTKRSPNNGGPSETPIGAPSSTPQISKIKPSSEPQQEDMVIPEIGTPWATMKNNENPVGQTNPLTTQEHVEAPKSPLEVHSPKTSNEKSPLQQPQKPSSQNENHVGQQSPLTRKKHVEAPKSSLEVHSPKITNENSPLRQSQPPSSTPQNEENLERPSGSPWKKPANDANSIGRSPNNRGPLETPTGAPWSAPGIGKTTPSLGPLQEDIASRQIGSPLPTSKNNENRVGQQSPSTTQQHVGAPKTSFKVHSPNTPIKNSPLIQSQPPSSTQQNEENLERPSRSPWGTPNNDDSTIERSPNNEGSSETPTGAPSSTPQIGKITPSSEPQQEDMMSPKIRTPWATTKNNENPVGRTSPSITQQHVEAPKSSLEVHSPKITNENSPLRQSQPPSSAPQNEENLERPSRSPWETSNNDDSSVKRTPNNGGTSRTPTVIPSSTRQIGKITPSSEPRQEDMTTSEIGSPWATTKNNENTVGRTSPSITQQHVEAPKSSLEVHSLKSPNENSPLRQSQPPSTPQNEENLERPSESPWPKLANDANSVGRSPNNQGPSKTPTSAPWLAPSIEKTTPSLGPQQEEIVSPQIRSPWPTSKHNENHVGQQSPSTTQQHVGAPKTSFEVHSPITPIENGPLRHSQPPSLPQQNEENLEGPSRSPWETPNNGGPSGTPIGATSLTPQIGNITPSSEPQQEDMMTSEIISPWATTKDNENLVGRQSPSTTKQHVGVPKKSFEVHSSKKPIENGPLRTKQPPSLTHAHKENSNIPIRSPMAKLTNNANSIGIPPNNGGTSGTPTNAPWSTPKIGKTTPTFVSQQEDMISPQIESPWPTVKNNEDEEVGRKSPSTQQLVGAPNTQVEVHSPKTTNGNNLVRQLQPPSSTPNHEENAESSIGSPLAMPTINVSLVGSNYPSPSTTSKHEETLNSPIREPSPTSHNEGSIETPNGAPRPTPEFVKTKPSLEPQQEESLTNHTQAPTKEHEQHKNLKTPTLVSLLEPPHYKDEGKQKISHSRQDNNPVKQSQSLSPKPHFKESSLTPLLAPSPKQQTHQSSQTPHNNEASISPSEGSTLKSHRVSGPPHDNKRQDNIHTNPTFQAPSNIPPQDSRHMNPTQPSSMISKAPQTLTRPSPSRSTAPLTPTGRPSRDTKIKSTGSSIRSPPFPAEDFTLPPTGFILPPTNGYIYASPPPPFYTGY